MNSKPRNPDCRVPPCTREAKTKGFCLSHSSPNANRTRGLPPLPLCSIEGCPHDALSHRSGLCGGCRISKWRGKPRDDEENPGWTVPVYFVQPLHPKDEFRGPVKIGYSRFDYLAKRLSQFQNANPYPVRVLGLLPGGRPRERELHSRFQAEHIRGEWFALSPALEDFLHAVRREMDMDRHTTDWRQFLSVEDPDDD